MPDYRSSPRSVYNSYSMTEVRLAKYMNMVIYLSYIKSYASIDL